MPMSNSNSHPRSQGTGRSTARDTSYLSDTVRFPTLRSMVGTNAKQVSQSFDTTRTLSQTIFIDNVERMCV